MSGPSLYLEPPPSYLFKFPPDPAPPAVPPYAAEASLATPFNIPADTYNALLSTQVPITIAACYAVTVSIINAYNRRHGNKAWAVSRTGPFKAFVIAHNVLLAVYSFVTCIAMINALKNSLPSFDNEHGVVGTVDALCKIHGQGGLGNAAFYDPSVNRWRAINESVQLSSSGSPRTSDTGRLWNEGLGFWGWWFYLSKFYEVLDTFIIQAKGKRSSTLQTYHHAGAMLCMWAGMRFMSPPIWLFVTINSGIHALMYTYYTLSALRIRVPQAIKRTLTTMQIAQFVFGASFAGLHLFVSYSTPVSTAYSVTQTVAAAASTASAAALSASSGVASAAASAGLSGYFKKLAYRAAGEEGLAEKIDNRGVPIAQAVHQFAQQFATETRYRNQYHDVHCIDTTGQSFAIWLNLMYLFPLTALFVRFFIKSYIKRTGFASSRATAHSTFAKATQDAAHGVGREIDSLGRGFEDTMENLTARLREATDDNEKERLKREVLRDLSNYKAANGIQNGKTPLSEQARKQFQKDAEAAKKALEERVREALASEDLNGHQNGSA